MTVQRLIELLEEIENRDLPVMIDASGEDGTMVRMIMVESAEEVSTPEGNKLCLLTHAETQLFDEDGERLN